MEDYVDSTDAKDRRVSRNLLGLYANAVVDAMINTMQRSSNSSSTDIAEDGSTLWVVGHAIYLPAAALGVAYLVECDEDGIATILSCNTKEAEGYLIDLQQSTASYLSRPSSQTQGWNDEIPIMNVPAGYYSTTSSS